MRVAELLPGTEMSLADHLPRDALRPECMDKANLLEVKEAERNDPIDYWVIAVDDRRGLPDVASNRIVVAHDPRRTVRRETLVRREASGIA